MNVLRLVGICLVLVVTLLATAESKTTKAGEATLGPVSFDAEGADFKVWLTRFKDQLYDHWVLPQVILEGKRLRLKVELTIERSGAVIRVRTIEGSGNADFDKAAQAALREARFLPLPKSFPSPSVTIELPFTYAGRRH